MGVGGLGQRIRDDFFPSQPADDFFFPWPTRWSIIFFLGNPLKSILPEPCPKSLMVHPLLVSNNKNPSNAIQESS